MRPGRIILIQYGETEGNVYRRLYATKSDHATD